MPKIKERRLKIEILEKLLNLIYPPVCGLCNAPSEKYLCKKCEINLKKLEVLGNDIFEKSYEENKYLNEHIYGFMYDGIIRKLILSYKFNYKSYIYRTFVTFFEKNEKIYLLSRKYDIIMPVPISKKRHKKRGYNQSSLFAEEFAKKINLKYEENILLKTIDNKKQSDLSKEERIVNAQNVYKVQNYGKILNKKILLIDDVFTTGSTCNECAKVLKEAGALNVGVFTIAKD